MAYTPTEWKTGDIVTAEKLNKLENGIMSGAQYIPITHDDYTDISTLEASYNDIINAINNGQMIFCEEEELHQINDNYTCRMMSIILLENIREFVDKADVIIVYGVSLKDGSEFYSYTSDAFMTSEMPVELLESAPIGDVPSV